jgi:excinuclease ABC subunit C
MRLPDVVTQKLDALPASPGVYVFLDKKGGVLYVGKARSLRSRVRSYFQPGGSDTRFFIERLDRDIGDLETFVVANEKEAALLENALIKERKPRYNFKLRDDKDFLSLRLDPRDAWPRLTVLRRPKPDGAWYFGPYDSATSARRTLRTVNRFFKLRTCRDSDFARRERPCLQYQIKRCAGPCVYDVDRVEYGAQAELVKLFLEGRHDELVHDLEDRMKSAAGEQAYERAASYRDQLRAIDRVREEQRVEVIKDVDQDAIGLFVHGDRGELAIVMVRGGRMTNVRTFDLDEVALPDEEIVAAFVASYYPSAGSLPDEILLPTEVEAMEGLADVLSEERRKRVRISVPQRGGRKDLVRMATENAEHAFKEKQREREDVESRLAEVQAKLRLPKPPHRIECIDVSHTGGTDTVSAITALLDGAPDRKRYKSFHVRRVSGGDDFGAMREVLSRRLARAGEAGWELPDLLVVDGGRGQLGIAVAVLEELGITDLPVCGLAKEKENVRGETMVERVYLPGQKNPISLRERSATRHFLTTVRDEAHRASNELRKKLGKRRRLRSGLDDVPGVGKKTRTTLLRVLGSLRAISSASVEELIAAGASRKQAEAVRAHFAEDEAAPSAAAEAVPSDEAMVDAVVEHDVALEDDGEEEAAPLDTANESTPGATPAPDDARDADAIDNAFTDATVDAPTGAEGPPDVEVR